MICELRINNVYQFDISGRCHRSPGTDKIDAIGIHADTPVAGSHLLLFTEDPASMQGEYGIKRQLFKPNRGVGRILGFQHFRQQMVCRGGGFGIFEVLDQHRKDMRRKNLAVEVGLHQLPEGFLPLFSMGQRPRFAAQAELLQYPAVIKFNMMMCQFMHQGDQEGEGIEGPVNSDLGGAPFVRCTEIAGFGGAVIYHLQVDRVFTDLPHNLFYGTFGKAWAEC